MTEHNHAGAAAIILAAGRGTRMRSDTPKVLHRIASAPMLAHVMHAASDAGCEPLVVVSAPDMPEVAATAQHVNPDCRIAIQHKQQGTAHAVLAAKMSLADHMGNVLVLFGDSPLMTSDTFARMQEMLSRNPSLAVVVLGFYTDFPPAYGRLILDDHGALQRIVEAKDATPDELEIGWCNSGVMAIRGSLVWDFLEQIGNDNAQGEYYLTDVVAVARKLGYSCAVCEGDADEVLGVNSRAQLADAEAILQDRLRTRAMEQGATLVAPETVYFAADTELGRDVLIEPNVFFGPNVTVGDNVHIKAFSHIEGAVIGNGASVGPFARLRPGSGIGEDVKIGNFVEIKKAQIEKGAKISHLSYIGDAHVGEEANIGAGTITCNYDGYKKYHTEIGREVFIGSNSALVAPVVIGAGAYVGAGSVVTDNVEADALALSRTRQTQKDEWAKNFRKRSADAAASGE